MTKTENDTSSEVDRTVEDRIDELRRRRRSALQPGGRDAAQKQHDKGKLTARERLEILMDAGSFVETDPFAVHRSHDFGMDKRRPPGDGCITGYGTIDGRKTFVASQDFTVFGGSMGEVHRSSRSTTPAAPGSRRARPRSPATATSSSGTCGRAA